ncbi:uncharacterized protein [Pempheris klunzingeri]|uniref:uncharacterized protein n=1 Tax=Pempheris klunzingeri TaxID=3127111 RepID=UPI00397EFB33
MEEAYSELYQQFLRLKSLCLRQAALLHQLTNALQKHQGDAVHNGDLGDMTSIPVQCTHEIPVYLHESPLLLEATGTQRGGNCLCGNAGTFSDLLAEDMSRLCVDVPRQRKEDGTLEQKVAPLLGMDSSRCQGASSNFSKNLWQVDHPGDRPKHAVKTYDVAAAGGPALVGDILSESGGRLMSDVALQSHICEFCQAVFPGDTTTRGEFLRHLYTHVT